MGMFFVVINEKLCFSNMLIIYVNDNTFYVFMVAKPIQGRNRRVLVELSKFFGDNLLEVYKSTKRVLGGAFSGSIVKASHMNQRRA